MKEKINECELLTCLKNNDPNVFDAIYHPYFNPVFVNALKLLRNELRTGRQLCEYGYALDINNIM